MIYLTSKCIGVRAGMTRGDSPLTPVSIILCNVYNSGNSTWQKPIETKISRIVEKKNNEIVERVCARIVHFL